MKTTHLLFLILILTMSCAGLMPGTSYAAPSQQTSAKSSANAASDRSHDVRSHDAEPAASADDGKGQKEGNPSDEQSNAQQDPRRASAENHLRSRALLTAAKRPKQLTNSRKHSIPGNAMNLHQPGSKSDGAAKAGLIQNETVNNALPVRPRSVVRPTASLNPSLNNVRHRGPNPAVVGGSANSDSRDTGAINGTHMHRKP